MRCIGCERALTAIHSAQPRSQEYMWPCIIFESGLQAMAVRGEETEQLAEGKDLDGSRKVKSNQILELGEDGMSELASVSKTAGLEELFLTAMKIVK